MSMQPKPWPEVRARLKGLGLVQAGGRQRTDSTHVLGRIRSLNRLELAGETIRAALEALAVASRIGWPLSSTPPGKGLGGLQGSRL